MSVIYINFEIMCIFFVLYIYKIGIFFRFKFYYLNDLKVFKLVYLFFVNRLIKFINVDIGKIKKI